MTWPYEEDFDALTTGNIGGQDSWVNEVNTPEVSTTEDLNGSGKSYKLNGAVGTERARRAVTLTTTGVFYYATKITTSHTSGDGIGPQLRAASNTKYVTFVKFAWDGGLELQYLRDSAPVYVTLASGLSTNTWYILAHEYDTTTDQVRYKWKVKGGSWSSWTSWETAYDLTSGVDTVRIGQGGTWVGYLDNISASDPDVGGGGGSPTHNALAMCNF